jgi:hypothetical protein
MGNVRLLLVLVVFVIDAWSIAAILASDAGRGRKARWILAIVFLPIVGFFAWLRRGPRPQRALKQA